MCGSLCVWTWLVVDLLCVPRCVGGLTRDGKNVRSREALELVLGATYTARIPYNLAPILFIIFLRLYTNIFIWRDILLIEDLTCQHFFVFLFYCNAP